MKGKSVAVRLWEKRKEKSVSGFFLRLFLRPLSLLFCLLVRVRRFFYRNRIFKSQKPELKVISIGNITVGGAGKTPLTLLICEKLMGKGKLAVVSRGYGSKSEKTKKPHRISFGEGVVLPPDFTGDEPYLIGERYPEVLSIVCASKKRGAYFAKEEGADIVLVDDGFQHLPLKRDLDCVIVPPELESSCLPLGSLREPLSALKSADLLIVSPCRSETSFLESKKELSKWSSAPVVGADLLPCGPFTVTGEIQVKKGATCLAFCAIAKPERFFSTLTQMGFEVGEKVVKEDHAPFTHSDIRHLEQKRIELGLRYLLCTEKDWVKIPPRCLELFPIAYIRVDLKIYFGEEVLEEKLYQIIS